MTRMSIPQNHHKEDRGVVVDGGAKRCVFEHEPLWDVRLRPTLFCKLNDSSLIKHFCFFNKGNKIRSEIHYFYNTISCM